MQYWSIFSIDNILFLHEQQQQQQTNNLYQTTKPSNIGMEKLLTFLPHNFRPKVLVSLFSDGYFAFFALKNIRTFWEEVVLKSKFCNCWERVSENFIARKTNDCRVFVYAVSFDSLYAFSEFYSTTRFFDVQLFSKFLLR